MFTTYVLGWSRRRLAAQAAQPVSPNVQAYDNHPLITMTSSQFHLARNRAAEKKPNSSVLLLLLGLFLLACVPCRLVAAGGLLAFPENATTFSTLSEGESYFDLSITGWGPNWGWMGFSGTVREQDGGTVMTSASGKQIQLTMRVHKAGARQIKIEYELRSASDVELTGIYAIANFPGNRFSKITATSAGGTSKDLALPLEKKGLGEKVRQFVAVDQSGRRTVFNLEPPCDIPTDGGARIQLAGTMLKAAAPAKLTLTIDLPSEVTYYASSQQMPSEPGFDSWYEFKPDEQYEQPSEIGLQNWIEAPAGKHGRIQRQGDKLVYNGQPLKLWGVNLCYGACAPDKEMAEKRAKFYRKYGINAVRLHKYSEGGTLSKDSYVKFDPKGLDRMDYLIAQLKGQGIYVEFSTQFGTPPLGTADKAIVPYLEEFGSFKSGHITPPHSASHYSPELQQAHIQHMVNLLSHRNPYTGLTYAEDPAIAFVEIINEQSILFYTSMGPLKASSTLRKYVGKRFCDWLRSKYGTQQGLVEAWGAKAFGGFEKEGFKIDDESLDKNNILPLGNPWYWDPAQLEGSQAFRKRRLLDSMRFLYELQNEFYDRFVKAVREAGYKGEVIGSNWQAGRGYSHLYNLHSDARLGVVDRHNYFGGGSDSRIDNASMLSVPGSALLSSGMQQVAGHPFMLSEWIHVTPNEWGVEGPAIIGAYGLGLQGWDVSFMFQNGDNGAFSSRIGRDRWDVTAPHVLGIFPAVARHILRGDVSESKVVAPVLVHLPSFESSKLGFEDKVTQQYDIKTFESDAVPAASLAAAKCVVEFAGAYRDTPKFNVSTYTRDGWIVSSTGQLRWKAGQSKLDGCFTLNTPATKGVVGFAAGQECALDPVTITPQSRYAAIYVTAQEKGADIASAKRLLVAAMARARNTGMKVLQDERILERGRSPVLLEPVKARIELRKGGTPAVSLLDHNGRRTTKTVEVKNGAFDIDGARDKTPYYLVEYPD